jgi:predicted nucleotidyltransferase component of viral defense system
MNGNSLAFWPDSLSRLQRALLEGLSLRATFYLTGGAALSAFFLHHRRSLDVDLFVADLEDLETLDRQLKALCVDRLWSADELQRSPGFRRYLVRDSADETVVDLVYEPVAQVIPAHAKPIVAGIRIDALEDLVANKLCALLGRGDVKDLVDLYFLEEAGIDVLDHLPAARRKDGGMESTTLAYVLRGMSTDTAALLLFEPLSPTTLGRFRDLLIERLLREAWPLADNSGSG